MKAKVFLILLLFFSLHNIIAQKLTPSQVYASVSPSIVQIISYDKDSSINSFGSGVVVGDSGDIYTNWHVIADGIFICVRRGDLVINDVLVAGIDIDGDIAILKIPTGLLPGIKVSNSDSLRIGDVVYALGNPMGYTNTISEGIISSFRNEFDRRVQFTASISPGSSGGALLNSEGELIGITSSTVLDAQNMNFAIPVRSFQNTFKADLRDSVGIVLMNNAFEIFKAQSDKNDLFIDSILCLYVEKNPVSMMSAYFFAKICAKIGFNSKAMEFANSAIMFDPFDARFYILKAGIYDFENEPDSAMKCYDYALNLDNLNYRALYNRAVFLKNERHDNQGAIRDFYTIINAYPGCELYYLDIAGLYLLLNDTAKALSSIRNSYFAKIEDPYNLSLRAQLLTSVGKYSEAILDYDYAISKNPGERTSYFKRGIAYLKLGMPEDAASDFQKCISLSARDASSYCNLAYCYFNLLDFELAEANFEKAIRLEPKGFDAYIGLSITAFEQNKIKKCLQSMSKAIELRPVLKKGLKGIAKITEDGYFWQSREMKGIKNVFVLMNMEEPEARDLSDDGPRNATGRQIQIRK